MKLQSKTIFDGQIERLSKLIEESNVIDRMDHRFFNKWNMNIYDLAWNMFNRPDNSDLIDYKIAWYAGTMRNDLIEQAINIFWNSFIYKEVKGKPIDGSGVDENGIQFFKDAVIGTKLKTGVRTGICSEKGKQVISGILTSIARFLAPSPKKGLSALKGKQWAKDIVSIAKQIEDKLNLGPIGMNPNLNWRNLLKARRGFDNEVLVSMEFDLSDLYAVTPDNRQLRFFMIADSDWHQFMKIIMITLKIALYKLSICEDDEFNEALKLLEVTEDLTQRDCRIMFKVLFDEKLEGFSQDEISSALGSWADPLKQGIRKKYYEHMYKSIYAKSIPGLSSMYLSSWSLQEYDDKISRLPKGTKDFVVEIRRQFNDKISSLSKKKMKSKGKDQVKFGLGDIFQKVIKKVMIDGFMKEVQAEHDKWAKMI